MNRLMIQKSIMRAFFIGALMLIPSLNGMVAELTAKEASVIEELKLGGATPLHIAAYFDHVEVLEGLLTEGTAVSARDNDWSTALHIAAERGNVRAVGCLLAHGSEIEAQNIFGFTPLHCAAKNGLQEVIEILIASGAPVNVEDLDGKTPLAFAACNGHLETVRRLLDRGATVNEKMLLLLIIKGDWALITELLIERGVAIDVNAYYPLGYFAGSGCLDIMRQLLLRVGSELTNKRYQELFLEAAEGGCVEMVAFLLTNGARINEPDEFGKTALYYAVARGHLEATVFLLSEGALIEDRSLLHAAAMGGNIRIVDLLLRSGAEINSLHRDDGRTPLEYAARNGQVEAVQFLIGSGAHLEYLNEPIFLSHQMRELACAKLLFEAESPISSVTAQREVHTGNLTIVRMLIKAHPECIIGVLTSSERSAFGPAVRVPVDVRSAAKDYFEKRGYYISEKRFLEGDNPDSVFAVAAYFLDWQVLKIFKDLWLEKMRSWRDAEERNLLMGAIEMLDRDAVHWFLDEKLCSLDDVDMRGYDALCFAIRTGDMVLINEIASSARSMVCSKALELAERMGKPSIIRMLAVSHPRCIEYVEGLRSAKEYFRKRESYLQGRFHEEDKPDAVCAAAAFFHDWHVLRIFKDQWLEHLRAYRDVGKNLLMRALEALDRDALCWLLEERICSLDDVDSEGHDVLCIAIRIGNMLLINDVISSGIEIRPVHLLYAAFRKNFEIVARLALLYRYSACQNKPAGLNFFR